MDLLASLNNTEQWLGSTLQEAVTGTPSAYDMEQLAQAHTADTIHAGGTAQQAMVENAEIAQMTANNYPSTAPTLNGLLSSNLLKYAIIAGVAYLILQEL